MQEQENLQGVVIPSQTIADSDTKKRRSKKTLAQLPVYRSVANLKFIVTTLMMKSPRKLTKFFDQMLGTISEAKKAIGMADISRNPQDRSWYLDCARVLMQDARHYDLTTAADRFLPFHPGWVLIYLGSFAFWIVGYLVIAKQGKEHWYRFVVTDIMAKLLCGICFLV